MSQAGALAVECSITGSEDTISSYSQQFGSHETLSCLSPSHSVPLPFLPPSLPPSLRLSLPSSLPLSLPPSFSLPSSRLPANPLLLHLPGGSCHLLLLLPPSYMAGGCGQLSASAAIPSRVSKRVYVGRVCANSYPVLLPFLFHSIQGVPSEEAPQHLFYSQEGTVW